MTLLEQLTAKLGQDLMSQVSDAVGDDFDWDMVPRSRLNKVIGQRNALNTKLQNIGKDKDKDEEEDDDLQAAGSDKKGAEGVNIDEINAQHAKELANVAKRYACLDKLRAAGVKDVNLVLGQLDLEKINLKDDESLEGFDEQLNPWKESHPYMFQSEDEDVPGGTGKDGKGSDDEDADPFDAIVASYK